LRPRAPPAADLPSPVSAFQGIETLGDGLLYHDALEDRRAIPCQEQLERRRVLSLTGR
jgi:hypothetical protein